MIDAWTDPSVKQRCKPRFTMGALRLLNQVRENAVIYMVKHQNTAGLAAGSRNAMPKADIYWRTGLRVSALRLIGP